MSVCQSGAEGPSRKISPSGRFAVALLLAGAALPAPLAAAAAAAQNFGGNDPDRDIIINAPRLFPDIRPERQLDQIAIEGYGVSTVEDLLGEISAELGGEDEPLVLVNGERVSDIDDIAGYPVEALRNVQVLPRGSAVRVGGRSGQRVISLALHRQMRSATVTAAPKLATEGDWHGARGETIFTHISGTTRANITLRVRNESSLLESDRDIVQPEPRLPFATRGNVIAYPNLLGEIDPLLSIAAGQPVTVVPVPTTAGGGLAAFVANANYPAMTDLGEFRTLRPGTDNYDFNGTFHKRLAPWLSSTTTVRLGRYLSRSKRGLPSALFILTPENPASPFGSDVGLAYYGLQPLRYRSRSDTAEGNVTLNGRWRKWTANFNARHLTNRNLSRSERQDTFNALPLGVSVNPFAADLSSLIAIRTDRATGRLGNSSVQLSLTGPAAKLPAGDLQTTVDGRLGWHTLNSRSSFSGGEERRRTRRSEQAIRGAVEVPLTSRSADFLAEVGDLSVTGEVGRFRFSDSGTLGQHALGLTWEPRSTLRLRASIERTSSAPSVELLGNPLLIVPDVRVFDPLSGTTVDVVQVSGGNPELRPERRAVRRLTGLWRLVPRLNMQLNAEYTDTKRTNFVSALPATSAAIALAFPERFIRDSNGMLTQIDLRPINFDAHREKRMRWGFSLNAPLGGGPQTGAVSGAGEAEEQGERETAPPVRPGPPALRTYLQLTANHSVVFSDKILIRSGLDPVNLLEGGAIGIAGGRVRHQLDGTASVTSGGLGTRLGVSWRGPSELESRLGDDTDNLRFSPLLLVNLRTFADARRLLPESDWTKGLRLSLNLLNLTNQRQRVRDSFGNTPLQYQPGYRDPLGRTVEFEMRKVF